MIRGYTALVDQSAFGLPVTVFVQIRLSPHSTEAARNFESRIRRIDEVLDCHLMTGDTDYLLRVVVPSLEAYERFIRERIHFDPAPHKSKPRNQCWREDDSNADRNQDKQQTTDADHPDQQPSPPPTP